MLDEFDGFARRPKQTLLYNLLDALHRSDMQVHSSDAYKMCEVDMQGLLWVTEVHLLLRTS